MQKHWLAIFLVSSMMLLYIIIFFLFKVVLNVNPRVVSIDDTIHTWDIQLTEGIE